MIQKAPYGSTLQCTARAPGVSSTISKNLRRIRSGGQLQAFKQFILEFMWASSQSRKGAQIWNLILSPKCIDHSFKKKLNLEEYVTFKYALKNI